MAIENNKKGKLVRWNENRGFGFIKPDHDNVDIFIHISALKSMSRAPRVGDIIHYETIFDDKGKTRAINAKIEGVPQILALVPIARTAKPERANHPARNAYVPRTTRSMRAKKGSKIIPIMLIVMIVAAVYSKITHQKSYPDSSKSEIAEVTDIAEPPKLAEAFQCQGKVYCSEMSSYDEALFYLRNCPGTKMDGDNDGEPCERQF